MKDALIYSVLGKTRFRKISKIQVRQEFVEKNFGGSREEIVVIFMTLASERLVEFTKFKSCCPLS